VSDAAQLAAGGDDSCVVLPSGHIDCWGWNGYGQLGDGSEENGPEPGSPPVEVLGVSDAVQVAAGDHSCAVLSTGHVDCWGESHDGALGDGKERRSLVPVEVHGVSSAVQVAASDFSSCVLLADGHVDCWGEGEYGQLGDGATTNSSVPVEVQGISNATQVSTGGSYACAVLSSGRIDCWGANYYGQLGNGAEANSSTPAEVQGISNATQVAAGEGIAEHVCALMSSGRVDCWGRNESGQLGDGATASSRTPVEVHGVADATEVGSGRQESCALLSNGHVECWGGNELGQLGVGALGDSSSPVEALGISEATQVTAGDGQSCVTLSNGHLDCWGGDESGQLGDGSEENRNVPVAVQGISNDTQVAAGGEYSCALLSNDHADCWGENKSGQLGDGTEINSDIPVEASALSDATQLAAGESHSCASLSTGHVDCWGGNGYGELGNGTEKNSSTPVEVQDLTNAIQVAAGDYHSCALLSTGRIDCWGDDEFGQLGDGREGERATSSTPVEVRGIANATEVAAGRFHSCALLSTGHIDCWGRNDYSGELGDGSEENSDIPVEVHGLANATMLTAGSNHSCALLSTGHINCWGEGESGELGDGNKENSSIPVEVQGIANATQVAAGGDHSCALLSDNHVDCWGANDSGELGDGLAWSEVPGEVVGLNPAGLSGGPGPSSPSAVTGGVSSVAQSSATLEGSVNPNGNAVASWCRFEYGPSEAYGSSAPCSATLTSGSSPENVSSSLTGLSVGTSYHYRLVAVNAAGSISYGADKTFKTKPSLSVSGPLGGAFAGSPIASSSISATLTAGSALTGTITFTVFGPQSSPPSSCTSGGATVGTASVSGGGSFQSSAGFTPPSPGDYWWYASYGGEPAASTCGPGMAETIVGAKTTPTLSPVPTNPSSQGPGSSPSGSEIGIKTPPPVLSGVKLSSGRSTGKKRIALKLTLSQPATIKVLIAQIVKAHKHRGVCKLTTKKGKGCTATVEKRTLTFAGAVGSNTLKLKLARLAKGTYTATISAQNGNGNSNAARLIFTITHG
jgi:alpha-tubulin suppressor-like RCC1 family protein